MTGDHTKASAARSRRSDLIFIGLAVLAFGLAAYGPSLALPFMGDDYVFLDQTRDASFAKLWSRENTTFRWYRPWSREAHFWTLQHVAGAHAPLFRFAGIVLWTIALTLYGAFLLRNTSRGTAIVATLGTCTLALWGAPMLWISGSQDLWMLVFALATLLAFAAGRPWVAAISFAGALLSKETAAVVPALLLAYALLVDRTPVKDAFRRTLSLWLILGAWAALHPTLHDRILSNEPTLEVQHRPPAPMIVLKTVLSTVNLDLIPKPESGSNLAVRTLIPALIVAVALIWGLRRTAREATATTGRLAMFGMVWTLIGWSPLLLPSIGWHAYYGCLGAMGAWLVIALVLERHRRMALALIPLLAVIRGAHASTPSWDWGNEWYQRRSGNILSAIHGALRQSHPTLPPHSRVFFGRIPNNIGLIAGSSPALRVWYHEPTLEAGFYSSYRPRHATDPGGEDFFFRFDTLRGMVEVKPGSEPIGPAAGADPDWERDHDVLAMIFVRAGDPARAAREFEKLSLLPHRSDAEVLAGVCWRAAGDTAQALARFASAGRRLNMSPGQVLEWADDLSRSMPAR